MLALRIIVGLGLAYTLLLLVAWLFQDRLAFPAPRAKLPDPKRLGVENGERVELVSGDGTKLVGWYLTPKSPTSAGLLWFYGNGETVAAIWPIVREFQPPGTAVLVLDYPGYGGSGGRGGAGRGGPDSRSREQRHLRHRRAIVPRQDVAVHRPDGPLDHHHRDDPVPRGLEAALRLVQRAQHDPVVAVGELAALRDPSGRSAHHDERAGHFAAIHIRVGMPGDEQLLEQRQAAFFAQHVEGLEDFGAEEPAQQLVAADPLEQEHEDLGVPGVVARRFDGGGNKRVVRARCREIPLEQQPRTLGVPFGQREEREVATPEWRPGVGDHGAQARDAPARTDERGSRGMLPPLELGHAEGHDVRIGERGAPRQRREKTTVHLIERGLEGLAVRPSRAPERVPREPVDMRRLPRALEGLGIGSREEPLECAGKSVEASRRFHSHQATPDWPAGNPDLPTSVWKTKWKSCGWGGECCACPWVSLTLDRKSTRLNSSH